MKKNWGLWTISLLSIALLAVVGLWGYRQQQENRQLQVLLNNKYQMAFHNMSSNVQSLENALAKSLTATGHGEDAAIFSEIWLRADAAQGDLAQLPVSSAVTERTSKFLSQAGDYAHTISRDIMDKKELSEQHWNTLNRLYKQASQLNSDLNDMNKNLMDGKITMTELKKETKKNIAHAASTADQGFDAVNRNMQTYPTLIYDGPFSDHLAKRQAEGLTGKKITSEQAQAIALKFIDPSSKNYNARVVGKNKGRIEAYTVESVPRDSNSKLPRYTTDVSVRGGEVIWCLANKQVDKAKLTIDQAQQKAQQFLAERGFKNMQPTYHSKQGNTATIQFVAKENDVLIYPDQVKCTVALDDGRILGYEASQYWMAKKDRDLPRPKISQEEAKGKINENLQVKSSRLAVIPLANYEEQLCWEFTGQVDKDTFLVYVNAENGKKEKVLRLVETPDGQLTF